VNMSRHNNYKCDLLTKAKSLVYKSTHGFQQNATILTQEPGFHPSSIHPAKAPSITTPTAARQVTDG
jgi:hypothetical protein